MTNSSTISRTLAAVLIANMPIVANACGVCFGEPGDPQTNGMNAAIGFLLVIVLGAGAALFYLIRVASEPVPHGDAEPPLPPPRG